MATDRNRRGRHVAGTSAKKNRAARRDRREQDLFVRKEGRLGVTVAVGPDTVDPDDLEAIAARLRGQDTQDIQK